MRLNTQFNAKIITLTTLTHIPRYADFEVLVLNNGLTDPLQTLRIDSGYHILSGDNSMSDFFHLDLADFTTK